MSIGRPERAQRARSLCRGYVPGIVVALGFLALPAGATAAQAGFLGSTSIRVAAPAGEANAVLVEREPTVYRITDSGAPLTAGANCTQVNPNQVTCPAAPVTSIQVELDDLNDAGTVADSVSADVNMSVAGEGGNDVLSGGDGTQSSLNGGDGGDVLTAGGHRFGDRLSGNAGNDTLNGGPGSDDLDPGAGNDVASGGLGDDNLSGGSSPDGADALSGGAGTDTLQYRGRGPAEAVTIRQDGLANDGGAGEGDNAADDLEDLDGGEGDDSILAAAGPTHVDGGPGDDTVDGGGGDDSVSGREGDDVVEGGPGDDLLRGDDGDDAVDGGTGDDVLRNTSSMTGADDGGDVLAGGPGSDLVDFFAVESIRVTLDGSADDGVTGEGDNAMPDLENVDGGDGDDTVVGTAAANSFDGGPGNDSLSGMGGPDGLFGARGADSLTGGDGTDSLAGGGGADRLRVRDGGADETGCGAGADEVLADGADTPRADCESVSTGVAITAGRTKVSRKGAFRLELACPAAEGVDCTGRIAVRSAQKLAAGQKKGRRTARKRRLTLATGKLEIASGETEAIGLDLRRRAEKALGSRVRVPARVSATFTDAAGDRVTSTRRVVLKRKAAGRR